VVCRFVLPGLLCLLLAGAASAQQESLRGRVVAVFDGDAIGVLTAENTLLRVRLAFIDAPEIGQAFGNSAKRAMIALVLGRNVELWPQSTDRYGSDRLVCVAATDGIDVGLEMLDDGLAWVYNITEAPTELQRIYRDAQRRARDNRVGLWQENNPEPPWDFRKDHASPGFPLPM
jgi:endonuclease YncB( thermonuclease family)